MSTSDSWREVQYNNIFEEALRCLERRLESDPGCTVEDIEKVLKNLYIMEGADLEGPGNVHGIHTAATIAAHEHFIAAWKARLSGGPEG